MNKIFIIDRRASLRYSSLECQCKVKIYTEITNVRYIQKVSNIQKLNILYGKVKHRGQANRVT